MSNIVVVETATSRKAKNARARRYLNLSLANICYLWAIYRNPSATISEVCDFLESALGDRPERADVNQGLDWLVGKGFLVLSPEPVSYVRQPGGGARCRKFYSLTPEGETAILDGEWALKQVRGFSV